MKANRERGQVAIGLIVIVLIGLCGVVAVQYWHQASHAQRRDSQDQVRTARWAEAAIDAYAAWEGRLPCPASTPGGTQDCSLQGKGWLPVQTLLGHAPAPSWQPLATRYVVYRAPARDLAEASDVTDLDEDNPEDKSNGYDLCQKVAGDADVWRINGGGGGGFNRALAHSKDEHLQDINVAYGLAVAGPSGVMSSLNADAAPGVEAPSRERGMTYHDYTVAVPFATLHRRLGCGMVTASAAAMASALPYGAMVKSAKAGTEKGYWLFFPLLAADVAASTSALLADVGNLTNEADVTVQSTAYWVACPVCLNFPAAIATEATATGTSIGSLAWSVFGLATSMAYTAAYTLDYGLVMATPEWSDARKLSLARSAEALGSH